MSSHANAEGVDMLACAWLVCWVLMAKEVSLSCQCYANVELKHTGQAAPPAASPSRPPAPPRRGPAEQENEVLALESIYGEGFLEPTDAGSYRLGLPDPAAPRLLLHLHLPAEYPSQHPPLFELRSDYLPGDVLDELSQELEAAFCPGGRVGRWAGRAGRCNWPQVLCNGHPLCVSRPVCAPPALP